MEDLRIWRVNVFGLNLVIQGTTTKNGVYWSPEDILSKYKMCGSCYTLAKKAEVKNDEH